MTRYIIIGAGAVGASLAAEFESRGIPYALVGRGAQIAHIASEGLTYRRPGGCRVVRLNAFDTANPPALLPDDILLLTVKSQDVETATQFWASRELEGSGVAADLPLVTFQNGLSSEDLALRRFSHVYAASIMVPARFTEIGEVVVAGEPQLGIVTLGRYPQGLDAVAQRIAVDLAAAGYLVETRPDIPRWKAAKLEHNVTNAVELFSGTDEARAKAAQALTAEANRVLRAAGYDPALRTERAVDISGWRIAEDSGIERGQQSTWQSFTRGASSEVDYLNGEIARLARLHAIDAPLNTAIQRAAAQLARDGGKPGTVDIDDVIRQV
jgi:2-dehydropantoate 2-reductase